jgi:hypothetical protein
MIPQKLPTEPTEIDWARLAAFLDGEGHLRIHEHYTKHARKHNWGPTLYVYVTIDNTDARLVNWLKSTFGGCVNIVRTGKISDPWKTCFKWTVASRYAAMLLERCLPYFIIKREQAEIALAFQRTIGKQGKRVSAEIKAGRYALKTQLSALTKRGAETVN